MPDLIIFDGMCNLCARSVQFVLKHEASPYYCFASLQSASGAQTMRKYGLDPLDAKTFVVIEQNQLFVRSDAALCIARRLRMPWRLLVVARIVPRSIRNWAYDLIARHRYAWFGRRPQCWLPSEAQAERFID